MTEPGRTALLAHPSPDLYGSDLQLLETVSGFVTAGWRVVAAVPEEGPLLPLLRERGAEILTVPFPVLRKALLHPRRILGFFRDNITAVLGARRLIRSLRPDVVWVNTLTLPLWLVAATTTRTPRVVHVHEAVDYGPLVVRAALVGPLRLAKIVVGNSQATLRAIARILPSRGQRVELVYNGVSGPQRMMTPKMPHSGPTRIALIGRLNPQKGAREGMEAIAELRSRGYDLHLDLYGSVFPGYEWFEQELRERASQVDLRGAISFHGYVRPVWEPLNSSDIVIVPSHIESFGNVAVEAQLAYRPVVVSAVQGLTEIVTDGVNGLHVEPDSPRDLARALKELLDDPARAAELAQAGHENATSRFSVERYQQEIARVLEKAAESH